MAFIVDPNDQQTNFKHFCRVCKKGFMCGRALGGHMRAHGIGDESGFVDEEDPTSDWEERGNSPGNKRMYKLRTNPNRLKSCRVCANCGKEFLSWKSFLEHGKCSSDSPESSPESDGGEQRGCQWSKRKRSLRSKVGSSNSLCTYGEEEDYAATCLVMLSNARINPRAADQPEESCASASKEEERRKPMPAFFSPATLKSSLEKGKGVAKGMFECKACKKVFNSHQALGGHRASHKKVKGCFATRLNHNQDGLVAESDMNDQEQFFLPSKSTFQLGPSSDPAAGNSKRKTKVHECSVCHRIFTSGQALGGHKRCHWITSNSPETSSLAKFHKLNKYEPLDLSLVPARSSDLAGIRRDPRNLLSFEVSTEINLQSWIDVDTDGENNNNNNNDNNNNPPVDRKNDNNNQNVKSVENVEDEADSKVKLAKLSELKDMNMCGDSSGWLQVGIGSTTGVAAVDP